MHEGKESRCPCLLIMAQLDHACGDIIASVLDQLISAGARNVNLVASLTKKGRPGYLLYVDVPSVALADVERILTVELGLLGWRILEGEHRGPSVEETEVDVSVCADDPNVTRRVPAKLVRDPLSGSQVAHIEHEFCVRLQQELRESCGIVVPLRVLKARLHTAVANSIEDARTCGSVNRKESDR